MRVGIVPARSGSKGIKHKNIVDLNGKPLIAWTIEQMVACPEIDKVYVSSDCPDILEISEEFGAIGLIRPTELSGDNATSESAWLHALGELKKSMLDIELLVLAQATSPLRRPYDFSAAIEQFELEELDSLFSSNPFEDFFYWETVEGQLISRNYDYKNRQRRQNIPVKYHENGSFYLVKPTVLEEHHNRLGGKIGTYQMEKHQQFQIDEPADMAIVTAIMQSYGY